MPIQGMPAHWWMAAVEGEGGFAGAADPGEQRQGAGMRSPVSAVAEERLDGGAGLVAELGAGEEAGEPRAARRDFLFFHFGWGVVFGWWRVAVQVLGCSERLTVTASTPRRSVLGGEVVGGVVPGPARSRSGNSLRPASRLACTCRACA